MIVMTSLHPVPTRTRRVWHPDYVPSRGPDQHVWVWSCSTTDKKELASALHTGGAHPPPARHPPPRRGRSGQPDQSYVASSAPAQWCCRTSGNALRTVPSSSINTAELSKGVWLGLSFPHPLKTAQGPEGPFSKWPLLGRNLAMLYTWPNFNPALHIIIIIIIIQAVTTFWGGWENPLISYHWVATDYRLDTEKKSWVLLGRCPNNEGQAHKTAATAAEWQKAECIYHNQSDEREQVWNRVATLRDDHITGAVKIHIVLIEPKDPHTADNDPHKEEHRDKTLQAAASFLAIVRTLLVTIWCFLLNQLENSLDDIDQRRHKANDTKDDKPDRDTTPTRAIIQVHWAWTKQQQ